MPRSSPVVCVVETWDYTHNTIYAEWTEADEKWRDIAEIGIRRSGRITLDDLRALYQSMSSLGVDLPRFIEHGTIRVGKGYAHHWEPFGDEEPRYSIPPLSKTIHPLALVAIREHLKVIHAELTSPVRRAHPSAD